MKKIAIYIVSILLFSAFTYFSYQTYTKAIELESINTKYYNAQTDIGDLIKRRFSSVLSTLSFGVIKDKEKKKIDLTRLKAQKIILKEQNQKQLIYLAILATFIVITLFMLDKATYAILLSLSSLVALTFGIITPILMIVIHKQVNYLGDVILSYESKTIVGTIEHLYSSHNYPVALIILLFSVVVPFIKSLLMLIIAIFKEFHIANKLISIFKHLGKWSMLDVFVVSLLLVYLSVGSSQNSYSEIENGLYLFLIYVILSLINSIIVERLTADNRT